MEYREYRGNSSNSSSGSGGPGWLLVTAILILCLVLLSLPAIIAAFFAQRFTYRYLARFGWRWSAAIWLILGAVSMLLLYNLMQHGLTPMMQREVGDYIQSGKHYQFDLFRWPLGRLWSETWPVWLRTWSACRCGASGLRLRPTCGAAALPGCLCSASRIASGASSAASGVPANARCARSACPMRLLIRW